MNNIYFFDNHNNGDKMKNTFKYLVAGMAMYGAYSLYNKMNPKMMRSIKNSVNKMTREASKSIENMM